MLDKVKPNAKTSFDHHGNLVAMVKHIHLPHDAWVCIRKEVGLSEAFPTMHGCVYVER